jgi:autotransporter-associated beta strand protein
MFLPIKKHKKRIHCAHRTAIRTAALAVVGFAALGSIPSRAATSQYWDTNDSTPGLGAGSGTWINSNASGSRLWGNAAGNIATVRWNDGNDAFFNGNASPAATITSAGVIANSVTFGGTGFTVSSSFLTLTGTASITTTQDAAIQSVLSGTVGVTKLGTAQLTLSGANTFTGTLTLSDGTTSINAINSTATTAQPLGQSGTAIVLGGASTAGTLLYTGTAATLNRGFTLAAGGGTIKSTTGTLTLGTAGTSSGINTASSTVTFAGAANTIVSSAISGSGNVTKTDAATLTLGNNNTFTGTLNVNAGKVSVATINATPTAAQPLGQGTGAINVGAASTAGTLEYTGAAASTLNRGINVAVGGGTLRATSGTITLGTAGATSGVAVASGGVATFDGPIIVNSAISGAGSIAKTNTSATLTLNNTQTYSGTTTINGGTFAVNGTISGSGGAVDINSGAKLAGTGDVQRTVNINTGGTISPAGNGSNSNVGAIATNDQNWNQGSTYVWEIKDANGAAGTGYDTINVTGAINVNATNVSNATKVLIKLVSNGPLTGWNQALNWTWDIATGSTGVTGFSGDKFVLDVTDFVDDNSADSPLFQVDTFGTKIRVSYVPEPTSITMLGGASLALLARRRRRN